MISSYFNYDILFSSYSVMWECWQQNPDKRPTFAELTAKFLRFISLQQVH